MRLMALRSTLLNGAAAVDCGAVTPLLAGNAGVLPLLSGGVCFAFASCDVGEQRDALVEDVLTVLLMAASRPLLRTLSVSALCNSAKSLADFNCGVACELRTVAVLPLPLFDAVRSRSDKSIVA